MATRRKRAVCVLQRPAGWALLLLVGVPSMGSARRSPIRLSYSDSMAWPPLTGMWLHSAAELRAAGWFDDV